jgi:alcohol dehydrogenase class IV
VTTVFEMPRMDRVVYGRDAAARLAIEARALGISRPLVVASNTLATTTDVVARLADESGAVAVFHAVPPHVPREAVLEATQLFHRHRADGLVSIGGGSPIDCAKAVALCIAADVGATDDLDHHRVRYQHPGPAEVPTLSGTAPPHIAVGTTLSGAEFTSVAGVSDVSRGVKDLLLADKLTPRVAILDPEIAALTPRQLWLTTGVRAIDHIVEGFYSSSQSDHTDALFVAAFRTLSAHLLASGDDPSDLERRERCQIAAWLAIIHLKNVSTGLSHGLGHQLGARFGVPHGVTSCILLPPVMAFNRPVTAERQATLAEAMGVRTSGMDEVEAAEAAERELRSMLSRMGVPTRLRDVGVGPEHFHELATEALQDMIVAGNPRAVTAEDALEVLQVAY